MYVPESSFNAVTNSNINLCFKAIWSAVRTRPFRIFICQCLCYRVMRVDRSKRITLREQHIRFKRQRPRVGCPVRPHTFVSPSADSRRTVVSYWRKNVHEIGSEKQPTTPWLDPSWNTHQLYGICILRSGLPRLKKSSAGQLAGQLIISINRQV